MGGSGGGEREAVSEECGRWSTEMAWKPPQPRGRLQTPASWSSTFPADTARLTGCALRKRMCSFDPVACSWGHLAEGGRNAG